MKLKNYLKILLWVLLVAVVSGLMVWRFQIDIVKVRIYQKPNFDYYISLFWEILKELAILLPIWMLSLWGLARSFLGENWLPITEKIPVPLTKIILAVSEVLLVGVTAASAVYSEYTNDSYAVQYMLENRFEAWKTTLAWILFYDILLYIEQRGIMRNCNRKSIRKQQIWTAVTIFLTRMIFLELRCVDLWYIPLSHVDCPNDLEDYYLWWFSLYSAVCILPLLFFAARKTICLIKDNTKWLALTTRIPKTITASIALVSAGLMAAQIHESCYWNNWAERADVPEYGEASAMGHTFQALMWGLLLFYVICLLVKQLRSAHRAKRNTKTR